MKFFKIITKNVVKKKLSLSALSLAGGLVLMVMFGLPSSQIGISDIKFYNSFDILAAELTSNTAELTENTEQASKQVDYFNGIF